MEGCRTGLARLTRWLGRNKLASVINTTYYHETSSCTPRDEQKGDGQHGQASKSKQIACLGMNAIMGSPLGADAFPAGKPWHPKDCHRSG